MPPTQQTRSDRSGNWLVPRAAATFTLSTGDTRSTTVAIPTPMAALRFSSATGSGFELSRPAGTASAGFAGGYTFAAEPGTVFDPAPALEPRAAGTLPPPEAQPPQPPPDRSHRIELIIDHLPNHTLLAPIPVAVDPLGDEEFTASIDRAGISTTGSSVGEALLVLKEQIESLYDDLRQKSGLDEAQKRLFEMLQSHIGEPSSRPDWV